MKRKKISKLAHVHEVLVELGYEARLKKNSVAVKVGGADHPFTAVVTHSEPRNHFQITCMVAKLGDVPEERVPQFAIAALDANNRTSPFAYALIGESDDPSLDDVKDWPVVLVHSVPIGDFSRE